MRIPPIREAHLEGGIPQRSDDVAHPERAVRAARDRRGLLDGRDEAVHGP
jgi:hypothetical protein